MKLSEEKRQALGVALNEASLLGCEVDTDRRIAGATLRVLTLPEHGEPPVDTRVQVVLRPVGRVAASLRLGAGNDQTAQVQPFAIEDLLVTVQSFGGQPVYGWEFVDRHEEELKRWGNRLSLDWRSGTDDGQRHSLTLFQEGTDRHLDLCLWFDELEIRAPDGSPVSLAEFCAGGKRWWDGMHSGDPRTQKAGITPLRGG